MAVTVLARGTARKTGSGDESTVRSVLQPEVRAGPETGPGNGGLSPHLPGYGSRSGVSPGRGPLRTLGEAAEWRRFPKPFLGRCGARAWFESLRGPLRTSFVRVGPPAFFRLGRAARWRPGGQVRTCRWLPVAAHARGRLPVALGLKPRSGPKQPEALWARIPSPQERITVPITRAAISRFCTVQDKKRPPWAKDGDGPGGQRGRVGVSSLSRRDSASSSRMGRGPSASPCQCPCCYRQSSLR